MNYPVRNTNKDELYHLFPLPCISFPTQGIQDGVLIRFKTFYLKIYDGKEDSYIVQGFRYKEWNPVFEQNLRTYQIREFAALFNEEDYLLRFQEPCGDPNCFLLGYNAMRNYI